MKKLMGLMVEFVGSKPAVPTSTKIAISGVLLGFGGASTTIRKATSEEHPWPKTGTSYSEPFGRYDLIFGRIPDPKFRHVFSSNLSLSTFSLYLLFARIA